MLEQKIIELDEKIIELNENAGLVLKGLKNLSGIMQSNDLELDKNFQALGDKIKNIDKKLSALHTDTNHSFDEVKMELVKIQKTTQYDELYSNLKIVGEKK
tara:strand:- start:221 stop:523 length:303 start_codon:yes stop_codon:yes gene_type:complete